jgi:hypothetical protein
MLLSPVVDLLLLSTIFTSAIIVLFVGLRLIAALILVSAQPSLFSIFVF